MKNEKLLTYWQFCKLNNYPFWFLFALALAIGSLYIETDSETGKFAAVSITWAAVVVYIIGSLTSYKNYKAEFKRNNL